MIERLKTLDCTDVATSFASSTCLLTAVWYIVTSGPNDSPHRKYARWETTTVPRKTRNNAIAAAPTSNDSTINQRRCASMYFADTTTERNEPAPKIRSATRR